MTDSGALLGGMDMLDDPDVDLQALIKALKMHRFCIEQILFRGLF